MKYIKNNFHVEDVNIQHFYTDCVQKHITQLDIFKDTFEPKKFTRKMGNLGSIKETKKSLEDLYKKS